MQMGSSGDMGTLSAITSGSLRISARRWWLILVFAVIIPVTEATAEINLTADSLTTRLPPCRARHAPVQDDPLPAAASARLGSIRLRHASPVVCVVYSPDGSTIASCTYVGEVKLWDAITGKERRKVWSPGSDVWRVAFSPDGKTLAGAGHCKIIRLWDLDKEEESTLEGPNHVTTSTCAIAFSPQAKLLATAGDYGEVHIWDLAQRKVIRTLEAAQCTVFTLAFSPDGKTLASPAASSTGSLLLINLWDLSSGEKISQLRGHEKRISSLSFTRDGKTLASGSWDDTVRLWAVKTADETAQIKTWGESVAFSRDGKTLTSGDQKGTLHVWEVDTGKEVRKFTVGLTPVRSLALSPDGKQVATACEDHAVGVWNLETGEEGVSATGHRNAVLALSFSPNSKKLASRAGDSSSRLWDISTASQDRQMDIPTGEKSYDGEIRGEAVRFSPSGERVTVLGNYNVKEVGRTILVYDAVSGKRLSAIRSRNLVVPCLDISRDGRTLAIATCGGVELWRSKSGEELRLLDFQEGIKNRHECDLCVCFCPDGRMLASGGSDRKIRFWDWTTGKLLGEIDAQQRQVRNLTYSSDGHLLASCGTTVKNESDGTVYLWEVVTNSLIRKLEGQKGQATCVAFSPDGMLMASASEIENVVHVWNVYTGKEVAKFAGHTGAVYCLAFSPDGKLLASGSADTTVLLWDVAKIDPGLPAKVEKKDIEKAWGELASENRAAAYAAIPVMAAGADDAIAFLKERLKPAAEADERRIAKLISDLDNDDFETRENATKELAKIGAVAEPLLKKALEGKPSEEARRRLDSLLPDGKAPVTSAEGLRELRALMVLERIGSRQARDLVGDLAKGAPAALLTGQAKLALERLDRRRKPPKP
jgi:WD40 repeat protein